METDNNIIRKDFQREALGAFVEKRDMFTCAPTGVGKTACYSYITKLWNVLFDQEAIVISPFIALMQNQVEKLFKSQGLSVCCVIEDTPSDVHALVANAEFDDVFVTPQGILQSQGKQMLVYREELVGLVIDEAHCITDWSAIDSRDISQLLL